LRKEGNALHVGDSVKTSQENLTLPELSEKRAVR
jgi:hypothetical protein